MTSKAQPGVSSPPASGVTSLPPRRGPGHRGQDARDTAAEMAQRAHEISLEAGSKMSGAIRDVISAAAGLLSPFPIESARDLVNYMVKRGQMPQEDADKLIATAEAAHGIKPLPKVEPVASAAALASSAIGTVSASVQRVLERASSRPTTPPPAPSPASKAPPKAAAPAKPAAAPPKAAAPAAPAKAPAKAAPKPAATATKAAPAKEPVEPPRPKAAPAAKPAAKKAVAKKK
jgi:polyhydroxyalkanoate synthesis regulator phasin